jgi:hypothetical protein
VFELENRSLKLVKEYGIGESIPEAAVGAGLILYLLHREAD